MAGRVFAMGMVASRSTDDALTTSVACLPPEADGRPLAEASKRENVSNWVESEGSPTREPQPSLFRNDGLALGGRRIKHIHLLAHCGGRRNAVET